jgi:hypothetical protein
LPERFRVDCAFGGGCLAALSPSRRNYSALSGVLASALRTARKGVRRAAMASWPPTDRVGSRGKRAMPCPIAGAPRAGDRKTASGQGIPCRLLYFT